MTDFMLTPGTRPHGYTGKKGTCHWCGNKMRRKIAIDRNSEKPWPDNQVPLKYLGDYGDGHFCTLRCGYAYGLDAVERARFPREQ